MTPILRCSPFFHPPTLTWMPPNTTAITVATAKKKKYKSSSGHYLKNFKASTGGLRDCNLRTVYSLNYIHSKVCVGESRMKLFVSTRELQLLCICIFCRALTGLVKHTRARKKGVFFLLLIICFLSLFLPPDHLLALMTKL